MLSYEEAVSELNTDGLMVSEILMYTDSTQTICMNVHHPIQRKCCNRFVSSDL